MVAWIPGHAAMRQQPRWPLAAARRLSTFLLAWLPCAVATAQLWNQSAGCADGGCGTVTVSDGYALPVGHSLPRPFDSPDVWMHGHHQRPSSYAGYSAFRPYNYRHVAAQTRLTSTWPVASGAPYSLVQPAVLWSGRSTDRRGVLQRVAQSAGPSHTVALPSPVSPSRVSPLRAAPHHALRPVPAELPVHVFPRSLPAVSTSTSSTVPTAFARGR